MNIEIFAEWLRHQGHQIHKTQHSYWYDQGPCVYQAFPYHWQRGIVLEVKRDRVKVYWDEHMGATWLMKNTLEVVSESG